MKTCAPLERKRRKRPPCFPAGEGRQTDPDGEDDQRQHRFAGDQLREIGGGESLYQLRQQRRDFLLPAELVSTMPAPGVGCTSSMKSSEATAATRLVKRKTSSIAQEIRESFFALALDGDARRDREEDQRHDDHEDEVEEEIAQRADRPRRLRRVTAEQQPRRRWRGSGAARIRRS